LKKQNSKGPSIQFRVDPELKKEINAKLKNTYWSKSHLFRVLLGWFAAGKFDRELEAIGLRYRNKDNSKIRGGEK